MSDTDLHISIGAMPPSGLSATERVEHELDLLKAALLYADRVTICGPILWAFKSLIFLDDFSVQQKIQLMKTVYSDQSRNIPDEDRTAVRVVMERLEKLNWLPSLGQGELEDKARLAGLLDEHWQSASQSLRKHLSHVPLVTLSKLAKEGVVQIHSLDNSTTAGDFLVKFKQDGLDSQTMTDEFIVFIKKALEGGSSLPLFDDRVGSFARIKIEKGQVAASRPQLERAKQTALMHELFGRLPLFENATLDEILDIRNDKSMASPLDRFRGAVYTYSQKMKSSAWDKDFATDADDIFRFQVKQAVSDIEEATRNNKYLLQLWDKVPSPAAFVPGTSSVIGMASAVMGNMPGIVSSLVGVGMGSAFLASSAYKNWKVETRKQQQNQLFFYYHSKRALENARRKKRSLS